MAVQIQMRRGTATQWSTTNPTLAEGEIGLELDTQKFKMGTGTTAWNSLSYYTAGASAVDSVNGLTGTVVLDTDDISEGTTNKYYTDSRVRAAVSASGSLSYNSTTGVFSYTQPTNVSTFTNDSGYLTSSAIGVTIQGYNANTVIDASYVHTDNNYTTAEQTKLAGIASGAEVNVNADWNAVSGDAQILNKPTIPTKTSDLTNDSGFVTSSGVTSVALTAPTGLTVSGSPVTSTGTLALTFTAGYSIPTTSSQTNWDTAYTERNQWDGGATGLNATTGRTSLGLGTAATMAGPSGTIVGTTDTQTLTNKRINARAVAAGATSGTLTPNGDTTDVFNAFGLTGAITLAAPSGTPVDGQRLIIRLEDNGTGRGITWTTTSGAYRAVGVTLPTTTTASKVTYIGCIYNSNDVFWDIIAVTTQV
jgi:hypothetical protein